jgi:putative transposase
LRGETFSGEALRGETFLGEALRGETFLGEALQGETLSGKWGMPARNASKIYLEDGYYHISNRGVDKQRIFLDSQDYAVFSGYLKDYLSPRDEKALLKVVSDPQISAQEKNRLTRNMCLNNFSSEITLMAYCLMPNHFHLFVKQNSSDAIKRLMLSLGTRYTMYFNRKHQRVGTLYQGVYKAALIDDEAHYLHISRYIHQQAIKQGAEEKQEFPSSYPEYLGLRKTEWVHPEEILSFFSDNLPKSSYRAFVTEDNPLFDLAEQDLKL